MLIERLEFSFIRRCISRSVIYEEEEEESLGARIRNVQEAKGKRSIIRRNTDKLSSELVRSVD